MRELLALWLLKWYTARIKTRIRIYGHIYPFAFRSSLGLPPPELLQAKGYIWPYIPSLVLIRIQDLCQCSINPPILSGQCHEGRILPGADKSWHKYWLDTDQSISPNIYILNKGVTINISQLYRIGVVLASWPLLLCCTLTKDWSERVDLMLQVNCGEHCEKWAVCHWMGSFKTISTGKYQRPGGCDTLWF